MAVIFIRTNRLCRIYKKIATPNGWPFSEIQSMPLKKSQKFVLNSPL